VAPISETIAWRETSGCPRQLRLMKLKRRCSILCVPRTLRRSMLMV